MLPLRQDMVFDGVSPYIVNIRSLSGKPHPCQECESCQLAFQIILKADGISIGIMISILTTSNEQVGGDVITGKRR